MQVLTHNRLLGPVSGYVSPPAGWEPSEGNRNGSPARGPPGLQQEAHQQHPQIDQMNLATIDWLPIEHVFRRSPPGVRLSSTREITAYLREAAEGQPVIHLTKWQPKKDWYLVTHFRQQDRGNLENKITF